MAVLEFWQYISCICQITNRFFNSKIAHFNCQKSNFFRYQNPKELEIMITTYVSVYGSTKTTDVATYQLYITDGNTNVVVYLLSENVLVIGNTCQTFKTV